MLLVITGNGKGKTTSAIGTAIRAVGWGKRVALVFFDKGGTHYGEHHIFDFFQGKMELFQFGLERFDETKGTFRFSRIDGDYSEAVKAVAKVHELLSKSYFLIVCDEVINAMSLGLIKEADVRSLVEQCPKQTHLLFTGRNAPEWLVKKADLVSEVKDVKHYFQKGIKAVQGLDY